MAAYRIARRGVVHVPEGRGIFPSLSVGENLEMAVASLTDIADPIAEGAALFPVLGDRLKQLAGSLSGGEQQMLALARALMAEPKLLMVDEISMGLAPIIVAQLFEALRQLAATGTSLLLVEQYVETALELADYVYVMEKGAIVDVGESADLRGAGLATAYLGGTTWTNPMGRMRGGWDGWDDSGPRWPWWPFPSWCSAGRPAATRHWSGTTPAPWPWARSSPSTCPACCPCPTRT